MRSLLPRAFVAAFAAALFGVGTANADAPSKAMLGAVPHYRGHAGALSPALAPSIAASPYDATDSPPIPGALVYHGGSVMRGPVTVRTVFWLPAGYAYDTNYQSLVNQFVSDVAAESGKTSNVFA